MFPISDHGDALFSGPTRPFDSVASLFFPSLFPSLFPTGRIESTRLTANPFQLHDESVPDVPRLDCWEEQVESVMEGKMERRQELESPPEMPEETRPDLTKQTTRRRR